MHFTTRTKLCSQKDSPSLPNDMKVQLKNFPAAMLLLLIMGLADCASPPPLKGSPDLLRFLVDGKTTRTEALATLGQPTGCFEAEKILTYRLGFEPQISGYYLVEREASTSGWPTWKAAKFSLVLVFDDNGILRKHSLVGVHK